MSWLAGSTHWSLLLSPEERRQEAWEYFYGHYHGAVEVLFRYQGVPQDELRDLAHEFFLAAFAGDFLNGADPARGRFRGYLRTAATRFLISHWRKQGRERRRPEGGLVELDEDAQVIAREALSPEEAFDRAWARGVLDRGLQATRAEFERKGKALHFTAFTLRQEGKAWAEVAAQVATTEGAARAWSGRVEKVLARFLRLEVAGTVGGPRDLDAELAELAGILGGQQSP